MLTKIILKDDLGANFKPELSAEVSNLKGVIDFLFITFPNFKSYILKSNINYSITVISDNWKKEITPQTPNAHIFPVEGKTVVIAPVFEAAGGDFFNRFFSPILFIGIGLATGNTALLIGGLVQGLQSILYGYPPKEDEERRSVNFQGGSPRTQEGTPIPIAIGSKVKIKDVMILSYDINSEFTQL